MSERWEGYDKVSHPSFSSLLILFMELLYFAPTERLISLAHATNLHRPDDDLVSNF